MNKMMKTVVISLMLVSNSVVFSGINGGDVKTEKVQIAVNKSKLITLDKKLQIAEISQGNSSISTSSLKPDTESAESLKR